MYKKVERAFSKVQNLLLGLIGIALTIMMSVIMLQTLTRYVIFYSLPWSEAVSYTHLIPSFKGWNAD